MKVDNKNLRSGGRHWLYWIGWLWTLVLLFGLVVFIHKMKAGRHDMFDLGEDRFAYFLLLGVPLFILLSITVLSWIIAGVWRAWKNQPDRWVPWMKLALLISVLGLSSLTMRPQQTAISITAEAEPIYLALASAVREQYSGKNNVDVFASDPVIWLDPARALSEPGSVSAYARKRLDLMVPSYWPRYLLMIRADGDCVVLARGSSMLGMVGVRIYDHGPVVLYSDEERGKNPYLPLQTRITDRLWFFTSD